MKKDSLVMYIGNNQMRGYTGKVTEIINEKFVTVKFFNHESMFGNVLIENLILIAN